MTLADKASVLSSWLTSRHIKVLPEWTEACIDWIQNECQGQDLSIDRLKEVVYDQWLDSDLAEIATPSLPEGLAQVQKRQFQGAYALQINSIQDVGSSAYSQLIKIKGKENENVSVTAATQATQNRFEPKPSRMLMMEVTDGHQTLQAMEYQPIGALNADMAPGTKILVHGDIMCRLGVLTLTGGHVTVLGGEVESLMEENSQDKLLARIIGTSLDDIPGGTTKPKPQTAPSSGRDTNSTVGNRQPQPPVVTNQWQQGQNVPSARASMELKEDDMMDEEILAGIDEEVLRELEESEYCSSKRQVKKAVNTQQPLPPEWPSDEDTDEEMLAAMIDNLEEQLIARGDTAVKKNINAARPPSQKVSNNRARRPNQSLSSDQKQRSGSTTTKQIPISSFMKAKPGSNEGVVDQEPLRSQGVTKTEAIGQKNRLSLRVGPTSSQFSAALSKPLPTAGKSSSSFVKAVPVQSAARETISATGGFVKAKHPIVASEPDSSLLAERATKMNIPSKSGFVKAQTAVIAPASKGTDCPQTDSSINKVNPAAPGTTIPAQVIVSTNGAHGRFIRAVGTASLPDVGELDQLPTDGTATPILPFIQAGTHHQKMAVATRFSKDDEEERRALLLKRRRSSSNADPAPFRYLSEVMDSITSPTEAFTFDIRGFIMTLLSSLRKEGNQWSLEVKLNDGSASLDAVLGNEVLQELIGFSVSEMKQMRFNAKSQEEKATVEAVQKTALDQCRKKLVDLCEMMTIQVLPGEKPTVIGTRKVTEEDVKQLKECL